MPPIVLKQASVPKLMEQQIDSVLVEFEGDARAAIGALLHNREELLRDADRAASLGFLRGRFSEGARPVRKLKA
ncbi:hypothetical protein [Bosea sp. UNC402CLCol]|jgi:hypothetical protein|uniref:hypothetical protein n=1 Tax=Bosea sp. UNC402CLCol TaxID=1510531 RepID=UPI000DDDF8A5|nr:hypothetical protein [Bosea sp. UNC402CLCol]